MRFSQFINIVVTKVAKNQDSYEKMRAFSRDSFNDGWEIWLQCESFSFLPESGSYSYSRGTPYPAPYNHKKCDFLLQRGDMNLWIELKVLLKQNSFNLIDRFADDLNKIDGIDIPSQQNSVGAFAVIPLDGAAIFTEAVKLRFRERSNVDMSKIHFFGLKPGVSNITGTYNSNPHIGSDRIVILYYVGID